MRNFFSNLGNKFRHFMEGRYGVDQLNRFILLLAVIFMVAQIIIEKAVGGPNLACTILYYLELVLLIWNVVRMLSKNIQKRYAQNQAYLKIKSRVLDFFRGVKREPVDKAHRIYKCPSCKQKVRVPAGRGRIAITCPKCHAQFIKKT